MTAMVLYEEFVLICKNNKVDVEHMPDKRTIVEKIVHNFKGEITTYLLSKRERWYLLTHALTMIQYQ